MSLNRLSATRRNYRQWEGSLRPSEAFYAARITFNIHNLFEYNLDHLISRMNV